MAGNNGSKPPKEAKSPKVTKAKEVKSQVVVSGTLHHVWDKQPARLHVKVERNSKGYNWEIAYESESLDEVLARIQEADARIRQAFVEPVSQ